MLLSVALVSLLFVTCSKKEITEPKKVLSKDKAITKVEIKITPKLEATIDQAKETIKAIVPAGTDLSKIVLDISHNGASISPDPKIAQNFSDGKTVEYIITAANSSTKVYTVSISEMEITEISEDIKKLIIFTGDEKNQTVVIFTQGGPLYKLDPKFFEKQLGSVNKENLLLVIPHQAQTLDSAKFLKRDITFEEAILYDAESIKILYKVIKYFKDQNRTVYLAGGSFGAFMIQELIAQKGVNVADKYLILVGRLDFDEKYIEALKKGIRGFYEDGTTLKLKTSREKKIEDRNLLMLAAGIVHNRYTKILSKYKDLSNITYIYGKKDGALGRLNNSEIQFLKSKNVKIIVGEGGHHDTTRDYAVEGLKLAFGIE